MSNTWGSGDNGSQWDQNPWDQSAPETNHWETPPTNPHAGATAPQVTPPPQRKGMSRVVVPVIIALGAGVVGVGSYLFATGALGGVGGTNDGAAGTTVTIQTTVPGAAGETADGGRAPTAATAGTVPDERETGAGRTDSTAGSDRSAPGAPSAPTARSARSVQPAPSPADNFPAEARAAGLTATGWSDNAVTRCGAGESLVYAGRGTDAWVTVCAAGGGMTYRSDVFGGTLNMPVDRHRSNPANGSFTIPASPALIQVEGDQVLVYQDGRLVNSKNLPNAWLIN